MVAAGTNPQTLESEGQGGEEGQEVWDTTEEWIQLSNVLYKGQKQHPEHQALAPRSAVGGACLQGQLARTRLGWCWCPLVEGRVLKRPHVEYQKRPLGY